MSVHVVMPEMGEGVIEGTVIAWRKQPGDSVKEGEAVLEVETDKVTVEIVAEADGVLLKCTVDEGATVGVGTVLAIIGAENETVQETEPATITTRTEPAAFPSTSAFSPTPAPSSSGLAGGARISPLVARMAKEHDLDLTRIEGTGRDSRITKKDVLAYLDQRAKQQRVPAPAASNGGAETRAARQPAPATTTALTVDGELVPLTGMRRAIAEHMVQSKRTSPHATTVFEFDFSAVAKHRAANKEAFARDGVRLTYMPYMAMAVTLALKTHKMVNASWTDEGVRLKRLVNLGIAVAVPRGLVVPVIRGADGMNLLGLARAINDMTDRARDNQLQPNELQGGTFTLTNHGTSGSLIGTPIINQPQVGILGVGLIEKRVKVINDAIAIRPLAYISFSFDHRVLDGASADAFVMDVKQTIENWT